MSKNAAATERFGWDWQRVDADRNVVEANGGLCYGCHSDCDGKVVGYDFTCADP
jgi:hypothetical protein